MRTSVMISNLPWAGPIGDELTDVAARADEAGFDRVVGPDPQATS